MVESFLAENQYGFFCIPAESSHRPAAQEVLAGRVWEPETTAFLAERGAAGDVLTAGAYFGDMIPAAAAGGRTVWAFEPDPVSYRCAEWTARLNGLGNVRLRNAALGDAAGTVQLQVGSRGVALGGSSFIRERRGVVYEQLRRVRRPRSEQVELVRIDDAVDSRALSVIHLDVERREGPALAGGIRTIERCLPELVLETIPADHPIWERITALGYRVSGKLDRNYRLSPNGGPER